MFTERVFKQSDRNPECAGLIAQPTSEEENAKQSESGQSAALEQNFPL